MTSSLRLIFAFRLSGALAARKNSPKSISCCCGIWDDWGIGVGERLRQFCGGQAAACVTLACTLVDVLAGKKHRLQNLLRSVENSAFAFEEGSVYGTL